MRKMQNDTGHVIEVVEGFSWTILFFGPIVPLVRGDLKWTLIMLIASACTFGMSWLVMPFIYNGKYIEEKRSKGYFFFEEYQQKNINADRKVNNMATKTEAKKTLKALDEL